MNCQTDSNLDNVCRLIRSTGASNFSSVGIKRPQEYPIDLFRRVEVKAGLLERVINRLRVGDIYNQTKSLPGSREATTALAQQSALLFVSLFFLPDILNNQSGRMREIVDKFFPDSWIVNIYMGITINLIDMWEPFRAARIGLANTLDPANLKEHSSFHATSLERLLKETENILKEGVLTQKNLLENMDKVLSLMRDCNVTIRWLILHTSPTYTICELNKKCKQVRDQVLLEVQYNPSKILQLLLNTAHFENNIREMFKVVLNEREEKWCDGKGECLLRMEELSEVFAGTKPLIRVNKNDNLRKWFDEIKVHIDSLTLEELNMSARKTFQLIQALDEVQGYQEITSNLQVKQLVIETATFLRGMLAALGVRDTILMQMQIIADFSYGWLIIGEYTELIQSWVKKDPSIVNKLRALFLKLSTAMETPLLRINQAGWAGEVDLRSAGEVYSSQLVARSRHLLSVVPETVFSLMSRIAHLQTHCLPKLPERLDKSLLREIAALEHRFEVAKLTFEVSAFSEGMLNMKSTLVGIANIDPKVLLEEGIRKELTRHVAAALEEGLNFNPKTKGADFSTKLEELGEVVEGHKQSFEYVQDYIGINGIKMWQEEMKKLVCESVEKDCKLLARNEFSTNENLGFVSKICQQLLLITDPKTTMFLESETAWFDIKSKKKQVDNNTFSAIMKALGVPGLIGIDRLIGFMMVKHLQNVIGFLQKEAHNNKSWQQEFGSIAKSLAPNERTVDNPCKLYPEAVAKMQKLISPVLDIVLNVGQLQLLRKQIFHCLNLNAKCYARNYSSALTNLNDAFINELQKLKKRETDVGPSEEDLKNISFLLDWIGFGDPYSALYVTSRSIPYLSLLACLVTISYVPRFSYDKQLDCMIQKKTGETLTPFTIGLLTLLKQFHSDLQKQYIVYSSQYAKSYMLFTAMIGKQEVPLEAMSMMHHLEDYTDFSGLRRSELTKHIPPPILDLFKFGIASYAES